VKWEGWENVGSYPQNYEVCGTSPIVNYICIISIVAVAALSSGPLPHGSVGWLCLLFGADHVHIVPTAALLVAPSNMSDIPQTPVLYCYLWCHGSLHLRRPGFSTEGQAQL
jgi:hypothetical protein